MYVYNIFMLRSPTCFVVQDSVQRLTFFMKSSILCQGKISCPCRDDKVGKGVRDARVVVRKTEAGIENTVVFGFCFVLF